MASGSFTSREYGYDLYLYCEWSSITNIAGNYSSVTIKTWVNHAGLSVGAGDNDCGAGVSGGQINSWTGPDIYSEGGRTYLGKTTVTVPHNNNGSKQCTIYASYRLNIYYGSGYVGTIEATGDAVLDIIPRATTFASVTSSVDMTGTSPCDVILAPKSTEFSHRVVWSLGDYSFAANLIPGDIDVSYNIPKEWCNALPNAASGTASVTVTTYRGNTQIGDPVTKAFTATIPADVVPTINSFGVTRIANGVPPAWGIYVQGKSKAKLTAKAVGLYSSSITKYTISGGGYSANNSVLETDKLNSPGTNTFTVTARDSRGRTTSQTLNISVESYAAPAIGRYSAYRCTSAGVANTNGTYLYILLDGVYSSCGGKNTMALSAAYRQKGATSWTGQTTLTDNTAKIIGGGTINVDNSYDVLLTVTDSFTSTAKTVSIPTALVTIDLRKGGKGVTIGGVAEEDGFTSKMPAKFTSDVAFDKSITASTVLATDALISRGNISADGTVYGSMFDSNRTGGGYMIRSSGNGTYPAWRFHANGENAWIHHWDASGKLTAAISFNPNGDVVVPAFIYASGAHITGNAKIVGDLSMVGNINIPKGNQLNGSIRQLTLFSGAFTASSANVTLNNATDYRFLIIYAVVTGSTIASITIPVNAITANASYWCITQAGSTRVFSLQLSGANFIMGKGEGPGTIRYVGGFG